jgi:hypothetical protein
MRKFRVGSGFESRCMAQGEFAARDARAGRRVMSIAGQLERIR